MSSFQVVRKGAILLARQEVYVGGSIFAGNRRRNINPFDTSILHLLNRFAHRSARFDASVTYVSNHVFFKGALFMAFIWWIWFRDRQSTPEDREFIISGMSMCIVTLIVARTLALVLPFRARPRYIPALQFRIPFGSNDFHLIHWSSFPSDNAAFYFSLATCLFFVSRKIGLFAYFQAWFVICVPRIYLGVHYPTDILGGALLGIGVTSLTLIKRLRSSISRRPLRWMEASPGSFYVCFYFGTFLLATEFEPLRELLVAGWRIAHGSSPDLP